MRLSIALACVLIVLSATASATTYYVSNSGSDSNPGTQALPWATLQKAVDTIAAGDTILVMPGTYVGCRIRSSGTAVAPKTLRSQTLHAAAVTSKGPLNRKNCNIELDADNYTDPNSYWVIDGFEIRNGEVAGVKALLAPNLQFINNWCHHNGTTVGAAGHDGFYGIVPSALFANNDFGFNKEHGLYIGQGVTNYVVIRDNVSHDNNDMGFHNNGDKGAPFDDDGICNNLLIERNIACNCAVSHGMDGDGLADSVIRNNLIYNAKNDGIMFCGVSGAKLSYNNRILNNTILNKDNWAFQIYRGKDGQNNKVFNNVLYAENASYGSIGIVATSAQVGFESNYNVVENLFSLANKKKTLAQWRAYGYDLNSIIATPDQLFVNPAAGDYHLKVGSPAANAGRTLTDVTDDLEGQARPQGTAYDIGCYEDF